MNIMDDLFSSFLPIIIIVFGILQVILFFKIWGMTDDIRALKNHFISSPDATSPPENKTSRTSTGWTIAFIFGFVALILILIIKNYI